MMLSISYQELLSTGLLLISLLKILLNFSKLENPASLGMPLCCASESSVLLTVKSPCMKICNSELFEDLQNSQDFRTRVRTNSFFQKYCLHFMMEKAWKCELLKFSNPGDNQIYIDIEKSQSNYFRGVFQYLELS